MDKKNSVFIATSIDGYIADKDGNIDWLHSVPNPDNIDMGYMDFMAGTDALIMGRTTFETVCGFDIDWPYSVPVFVLSNSLKTVPDKVKGKVHLVNGSLKEVLNQIHEKGHKRLYIDGGRTVQSFLKEDLIDEMIITIIPVVLGGGSSLFSELDESLNFECTETKLYLDKVVQNHLVRVR